MRLFVGIELPETILSELAVFQERLAGQIKHGHLTARDNLHITLRFLGDVSSRPVSEICQMLRETAQPLSSFSLRLNSAGGFGTGHPYRVIWAGIADKQRQLTRLYREVSRALAGVGFPEETRDYHPHITLGRDVEFIKEGWIKHTSAICPRTSFDVGCFSLLESRENMGRRIYRPLDTFLLGR